MKTGKFLAILLAGALAFTTGNAVYGAELADVQAQKQEAEAELAQTQSNISSLESKKQELENYLEQLNSQYDELTGSLAQLSIEAAEKEEELKQIQADLEEAKETADRQYEAMKIRIAYMYEKGGASALALLLSSGSFAEFLNRAENIAQISEYDREMLDRYEELCETIKTQENAAEQEAADIDSLMQERYAKQQEVQTMAESTSTSILSYVSQISSSQEEASVLMAEIRSADNSIATLVQQAEMESVSAEAADDSGNEQGDDFNPEEDTTESFSISTSSDVIVEEEGEDDTENWWNAGASDEYASGGEDSETYEESGYEEESWEDTSVSSGSGQGTYLGNFTLTAYCNCAQCCGTAGNLTASGTVPAAGRTVAMAGVPFGTQLLINGTVYTVEDLGTPYGHVDIYFSSHAEALSFGLQYADVYQVG
jgi:peptidoglycan hydrolase CwlO-like protein/3D (Asp-Asp-Asp) domain-containing protein